MTVLGATIDDQGMLGREIALDMAELVGSHVGIVANSGGGKSGLVRRFVEETHGQIQQIILDPEDEFYTLRQRFDYVIAGGDEGDVPATVANAEGLALAALTHGFSLIVQLNDLGEDAPKFVGRFLAALIGAKRELWRPLLVVIDEAHQFAPSEGSTAASAGVKALTGKGRKRGFTAVLASQRISKLSADVRGDINNWMLGRVGQTLDRNIMADQLGFTPAEGRQKLRLEKREFWGFGPALASEPVRFRVADVQTAMVKSGQAKVPTPPAAAALRAILTGLTVADPVDDHVADAGKMIAPAWPDQREEVERLKAREATAYESGKTAGIGIGLVRAANAISALRIPAIAAESADDRPARNEVEAVGSEVEEKPRPTHAARDRHDRQAVQAGPPATLQSDSAARPGPTRGAPTASTPSPAALAIAELLDRVNPARLTWSQAATLTGRKASGGNFNAARKWLRESGRIVEDGDFIRSAAPEPVGLSRREAISLWHSVLTNPAPRMIEALDRHGPLSPNGLAAALGVQPRGGNWNNGLAQLRRNGVGELVDGLWKLVKALPGEAA